MMETAQEILAKRIIKFPSDDRMVDEAIKRNVYAAMDEFAQSRSMDYLHWVLVEKLGFSASVGNIEELKKLYNEYLEHIENK